MAGLMDGFGEQLGCLLWGLLIAIVVLGAIVLALAGLIIAGVL